MSVPHGWSGSHNVNQLTSTRDVDLAQLELAELEGIPQNGARELLVRDPFTQGPRLFQRHCSTCHR